MRQLPKTFKAIAIGLAEALVSDFQNQSYRGPRYTPLTPARLARSQIGLHFTEQVWERHGDRLKEAAYEHALVFHKELEPERYAYTLGAEDLYDPKLSEERPILDKDEGGSVWRTLDEARMYRDKISPTVTVLSEPPYESGAGIYEVYLPAPFEDCVGPSDKSFAPLKTPCLILRRVL